jgi:hypothetical protein
MTVTILEVIAIFMMIPLQIAMRCQTAMWLSSRALVLHHMIEFLIRPWKAT